MLLEECLSLDETCDCSDYRQAKVTTTLTVQVWHARLLFCLLFVFRVTGSNSTQPFRLNRR